MKFIDHCKAAARTYLDESRERGNSHAVGMAWRQGRVRRGAAWYRCVRHG